MTPSKSKSNPTPDPKDLDDVLNALAQTSARAVDLKDAVTTLSETSARNNEILQVVKRIGKILIVFMIVLSIIAINNYFNGRAIKKTNNRFTECTTPSTRHHKHECYETGQRGQANAIAQLIIALQADNDAQTRILYKAITGKDLTQEQLDQMKHDEGAPGRPILPPTTSTTSTTTKRASQTKTTSQTAAPAPQPSTTTTTAPNRATPTTTTTAPPKSTPPSTICHAVNPVTGACIIN